MQVKSMSELEEKSWVLSRIEYIVQNSIDDFKTSETMLEKLRAEEREKILGRRNNLFSILGVSLTVILALYSTEKIEDNLFLALLFLNIVVGSIVFIIGNLFLSSTTSAFIMMENQIVEGTTSMSLLSGYINLNSAKRQNLSIEFLLSFLMFCYYVGISELIKIKNNYEIVIEESYLTKFSTNTFVLARDDLELALKLSMKTVKGFVPHQDIPHIWYEPAKKIIDEYVENKNKTVKV